MGNEYKLPEPVGAMWLCGFGLRKRFIDFLGDKGVEYTSGEVDAVFETRHTYKVKVNALPQKFIAIENRKRWRDTQPSYFLHTYQTHTGASPLPPWGVESPQKNSQVQSTDRLHGNGTVQGEGQEEAGVET
jgi:hypothetical protein